jgi:hypothetical protein
MRRLAGTLLIAALAVAPIAADLTIVTVTTIEGAMMAGTPGGVTPKVVVRISGTKSRMDVDTGDQVVTTISDSATNQAYVLRSEDKTAILVPTDAAPADGSTAALSTVEATVRPTGQKRDIDGQACDEYTVAMKLPLASLAAAGGSALPPEAAAMLKEVTLGITGSIWTAKDAPGAAEYAAFQKTTSQLATAMGRRLPGPGAAPTAIPAGLDRLLTGFPEAAGIPYLSELTTKLEGTGQLVALMQQMGQMTIVGKVSSISTEAVSTDIFNVPEGYIIVK